MSPKAARIWFVSLSLLASLAAASLLAECSLRLIDNPVGPGLMDYVDTTDHHTMGPGGYLRPNFKTYVSDGMGGRVRWANNAAGFRHDQEFSEQPEPGVLRILSLGDSFTAGYRVGQTETFSSLLESWARQKFGKVEVLVSEISEPADGLYYLDKFGVKFQPHVILLGLTLGNDICQSYFSLAPMGTYVLRVADGKFGLDLNPAFHRESPLEPMGYEIPAAYRRERSPVEKFMVLVRRGLRASRLMQRLQPQGDPIGCLDGNRDRPKLFDIVNGFGVFSTPPPPEVEEAYRRTFLILKGFQDLCESRRIILAVQLFPQRYQVQPGDWEKAVQAYGLDRAHFDLMTPNQRIRQFCREHNIRCIDPTAAMLQRYLATQESQYLPRGDMHWNREGHRAFFESARQNYEAIVQQGFAKEGFRTANSP